MKYSQQIGILLCIALFAICYIPWSHIDSINLTVTGMYAPGTAYGKPAIMNMALSVIAVVFFLMPWVWNKRINIFITAMNFAWAIRNYMILATCAGGECPHLKIGIYLLLVISFAIMVMSFLPRMEVADDDDY